MCGMPKLRLTGQFYSKTLPKHSIGNIHFSQVLATKSLLMFGMPKLRLTGQLYSKIVLRRITGYLDFHQIIIKTKSLNI